MVNYKKKITAHRRNTWLQLRKRLEVAVADFLRGFHSAASYQLPPHPVTPAEIPDFVPGMPRRTPTRVTPVQHDACNRL